MTSENCRNPCSESISLEFTVADAIEGARIQSEFPSSGDHIPIGDVMIAGAARNRGATLVAGDDHFGRIDGLDVENHRTWNSDSE